MTPRYRNRSLGATNSFECAPTTHLALGEPTAHPDLFSSSIDLAESSSRAVCSGDRAAALRLAIADPPCHTTNAKIRVRYALYFTAVTSQRSRICDP